MRTTLSSCVLLLTIGWSAAAAAKTPCASLTGSELARYNGLGTKAVALYRDGNFTDAISSLLALRGICDEDPVIVYNLARAYEKSGNCNMSRFWYEEVMARDEATFGDLVEAQKVTAAKSIARLEKLCRDSARVVVECEAGATAELGGALSGSCPLAGRADAGPYTLTITMDGRVSGEMHAQVRPGEINRFVAAPLEAVVTPSTVGTLDAQCGAGLSSLELVGVDTEPRRVECASRVELPVGEYAVSIAERGVQVPFVIVGEARTDVHIVVPEPEQIMLEMQRDETLLVTGWSLLGVGGGLLAAGIGMQLGAASMRDLYITPTQVHPSGVVESITQKEAQAAEDDARILQTIGLTSAGVGGALLLGGAVVLLFAEETVEPPQVSLTPIDDGLFVSFQRAW